VTTDKVYLVGFMGAGKTTVGRRLAKRLGWRFEDLDERIEQREQRAIADIFRASGEPYFRALERDVLLSLLPLRGAVVATGGGTFEDPANRATRLADGTVVWLDLPLSRVLERLPPDGRRPLAADRTALEGLFTARQAAYGQAHLRVESTAGHPEALVEELLDRLGW
jgi:shikimate kinase